MPFLSVGEMGIPTVLIRGDLRIPLLGCVDLQINLCLDVAFDVTPAPVQWLVLVALRQ